MHSPCVAVSNMALMKVLCKTTENNLNIYIVRNVRFIVRFASRETLKQIVNSFITIRMPIKYFTSERC